MVVFLNRVSEHSLQHGRGIFLKYMAAAKFNEITPDQAALKQKQGSLQFIAGPDASQLSSSIQLFDLQVDCDADPWAGLLDQLANQNFGFACRWELGPLPTPVPSLVRFWVMMTRNMIWLMQVFLSSTVRGERRRTEKSSVCATACASRTSTRRRTSCSRKATVALLIVWCELETLPRMAKRLMCTRC